MHFKISKHVHLPTYILVYHPTLPLIIISVIRNIIEKMRFLQGRASPEPRLAPDSFTFNLTLSFQKEVSTSFEEKLKSKIEFALNQYFDKKKDIAQQI